MVELMISSLSTKHLPPHSSTSNLPPGAMAPYSNNKEFLLRGNVVDLAVAVVVGAAFGAVVTSFVDNIIMPLIALIGGQPSFDDIGFNINDTRLLGVKLS